MSAINTAPQNKTLRTAAILAFSKFLCVSSQFCEQHHRLLFKILETSKDPNVRSNVVIALGDVAVCFSNIVDENSNELYKGLSDRNLVVKKNTLMVLTHLILNGMIKVKGQLGEMAKCLEDPDQRIADLAKLFFTELSTKDNAIYNNLPDGQYVSAFIEHTVLNDVNSYKSPFCRRARCRGRIIPKYDEVYLHIHRKGRSHSTTLEVRPETNPLIGEASRKHRRETLPAFPTGRRTSTVARHCFLLVFTSFQV